jgi:hypothetical protein
MNDFVGHENTPGLFLKEEIGCRILRRFLNYIGYIDWNDKTVCEWWIGNDMEGSSRGLF